MINKASDTTRPLDIALITPTLDGGVGRVVSLLAKGMNKKGISVAIWTLSGGAYENDIRQWSQITHLPTKQARRLIRPLVTLLKENKPSVVVSISFHINCMVIVARMLALVQTRLFISEHTSLDTGLVTLPVLKRLIAKICIHLLYRQADGWIAVSNGVAQYMSKYGKIPLKSVNVIYNPVITPEMIQMSREPVTHPFFNNGEPVILAVGRLSIEKNYPTLLRAFKEVNKTTPSRLIIIGDGPQKEQIEEDIEQLEISDRVSLLGSISNPYPYFVNSDLYVLSSIREGLPTTLIEALALGTSVVSTDAHSGPREILKDGEYGKLVPVKDSGAFAQAIVSSLKSSKVDIPDSATVAYKEEVAVDNYLSVLFLNEK